MITTSRRICSRAGTCGKTELSSFGISLKSSSIIVNESVAESVLIPVFFEDSLYIRANGTVGEVSLSFDFVLVELLPVVFLQGFGGYCLLQYSVRLVNGNGVDHFGFRDRFERDRFREASFT